LYKPVYNEEALRQLLALRPAAKREMILRCIEQLAEHPFQHGHARITDETGRENEVFVVGGHAITCWADHAVKELRVVDIQDLRR
jgi:hypothetical protein